MLEESILQRFAGGGVEWETLLTDDCALVSVEVGVHVTVVEEGKEWNALEEIAVCVLVVCFFDKACWRIRELASLFLSLWNSKTLFNKNRLSSLQKKSK